MQPKNHNTLSENAKMFEQAPNQGRDTASKHNKLNDSQLLERYTIKPV